MRFALVALVWLFLAADAGDLQVPARLEVDDGSFISIPIELNDIAESIDLEYPPNFKLLSLPKLHPGKILINFFVDRGTPSGEYSIFFKSFNKKGREQFAECVVFVRPRVEFALEAPAGKEILLGAKVKYWVNVINTGNVADEIRVELRMPDSGATIEPDTIILPVGGRGGFLVTVQPRIAQPAIVLAALQSKQNPSLTKYISIRTDVLPFAGADDLNGRSLRYHVDFNGGHRAEGWEYGVKAGIGGKLSDYVFGSFHAEYTPTRPRFGVDFNGDWGKVGARFSNRGYETYAVAGDWEGRLFYTTGSLTGTLSWRPGSWSFGVGISSSHQRFSIGNSISLGRWLSLEPYVFFDRYTITNINHYEIGGEMHLKLDSPYWLIGSRFSYQGGMFSASGEFLRRRVQEYSLRGRWFYNGNTFGASLQAGEAINNAYWASQSLAFLRGDVSWRLGFRYRDSKTPWRFDLGLLGNNFSPGGYGNLAYRQKFWELGSNIEWDMINGADYNIYTIYKNKNTQLILNLSLAQENSFSVNFNHTWEAWGVSGDYKYLFSKKSGSGAAEISYDAGHWALSGGVRGNPEELKWWLIGSLQIEGGFKTPEAVVQTFGGRRSGRIWGVVFVDKNKNNKYDDGEKKITGAYVSCGPIKSQSDPNGKYSLETEPKECQLSVQDPEGRYGLSKKIKIKFTANGNRRLDLGLVPVAGISGVVWLDQNKNGLRDEGERPLPGVEVILAGPGGFTASRWSDARGRFSISYLPPGHYQIKLRQSSLARLQQPGKPIEIVLQPGPLPFISMAVVPKELRKVQTFSLDDASIYIKLGRQVAPPGADLPLRVTVSGMETPSVYVESGGHKDELEPVGDGEYAGYLHVPENAAGAFFYRVVARSDAGEVEQEAMLVVRSGPLARLTVQPAFVDPGASVSVTASLLKRVEAAEVVFRGKAYPLRRQDDLTWTLQIEAPTEPGRYPLELWIGGNKWAEAAFRVAE